MVAIKILMLIYLRTATKNEFELLDVSENAVKKILSYLNTNEAGRIYQTPAKFLKEAGFYSYKDIIADSVLIRKNTGQ